MPDHQLPEAAWPLQYRHTERTVFTTTGRDSNPFDRQDLYERTLRELRTELRQPIVINMGPTGPSPTAYAERDMQDAARRAAHQSQRG